MKVAVLSYSGNVGKTTVAAHLLAPRIPVAKIHAVETINETATEMGLDVEQLRGARFTALYKELLGSSHAVVDVGASSAEEFIARMAKIDHAHAEIDCFVIPTVPGGKEQRDTVRTVKALSDVGVEPERIRLLFNRVRSDDVLEEFAPIFGYARQNGFVAKPEAAIEENEIFDLLASKKTSIAAVLADPTDYRKLLKSLGPDEKQQAAHAIDMHTLKGLALGVNRQFDRAYAALFG
ncbi:MAG TPA: StbB family protein [Anaeromyxobacteraceae bacterium]|nr:StbB family protein [Anaeromyxobacteraceae bacterium]